MPFKSTFLQPLLLLNIAALTIIMSNCKSIPEEAKETKRPNIVVMFTDELQFSDIGVYGGGIPTPEIDKLANEGMRFNNAYCPASMCTPSRFAILTGLYPGRCQAPSFFTSNPIDEPYNIAWNTWITPDITTLPRILSENGYITGMAGKWHIGHLPESVKVPKLEKDADLDDPDVEKKLMDRQMIYENQVKSDAGFDYASSIVWTNFDNHPVLSLRFHNFPWITKGALNFLDQQKNGDQPFFLFVTPTAIHGPNHTEDLGKDKTYTPEGRQEDVLQYNIDEEKLKNEIKDLPSGISHRYAGIANIDFQLGLIRRKLKEIGEEDNTILIFMSDHNIEPGKATSYEKGIHIPMIVYWPGITKGSQKTSSLISSLDVYPTILEAADIQKPEDLKLDGISFMSVIRNPSSSNRQFVFAEAGFTRSVSDGRHKYIALRYPESVIKTMVDNEINYAPSYVGNWPQAHSVIAMKHYPAYFDQNQLYELESDPYEQNNIYEEQSPEAQKLKAVLKEHLASFQHPFNLHDIEYLNSDDFKKHYEVNLTYDLANIPWLKRDHGNLSWPPKE